MDLHSSRRYLGLPIVLIILLSGCDSNPSNPTGVEGIAAASSLGSGGVPTGDLRDLHTVEEMEDWYLNGTFPYSADLHNFTVRVSLFPDAIEGRTRYATAATRFSGWNQVRAVIDGMLQPAAPKVHRSYGMLPFFVFDDVFTVEANNHPLDGDIEWCSFAARSDGYGKAEWRVFLPPVGVVTVWEMNSDGKLSYEVVHADESWCAPEPPPVNSPPPSSGGYPVEDPESPTGCSYCEYYYEWDPVALGYVLVDEHCVPIDSVFCDHLIANAQYDDTGGYDEE